MGSCADQDGGCNLQADRWEKQRCELYIQSDEFNAVALNRAIKMLLIRLEKQQLTSDTWKLIQDVKDAWKFAK